MSDAPKLPKGLPVESFDPGDLVYTAKDMEDFRAAGERDAAVALLREARDWSPSVFSPALRARIDAMLGGGEGA